MTLRRIPSGGPWEEVVGYCRAVVAGPWVLVSGSTATVEGKVVGVGDMYAQTVAAFRVALDGLRRAGQRPGPSRSPGRGRDRRIPGTVVSATQRA